jgi:hypothetical protein
MNALQSGYVAGLRRRGGDATERRCKAVAVRALLLTIAAAVAAFVLPVSAALADIAGAEGQPIGTASSAVQLGQVGDNPDHGTIDWGDGFFNHPDQEPCDGLSSYPLPTSLPSCYFLQNAEFGGPIYGYHTYAEQGTYTYTISWFDSVGNPVGTVTGTVNVADAPLHTGSQPTLTAIVGVPFSGTVGSFTDGDPGSIVGDYSASVDWGDGSALDASATVAAAGSSFAAQGAHTYTAAGTFPVKVYIADEPSATSSSSTTIDNTVTVSSSGVQSLSLTEGVAFSGFVARFCSPPGTQPSASIDWGDGSPADNRTTIIPVATAACPSGYEIDGSHTYPEEATTPYKVTATLHTSGGDLSKSGIAQVSDAALTATMDSNTLSAATLTIPGSVLAHVQDGNALAPGCVGGGACDLSATVAWGDGSSSQASIVPDPGGGFGIYGGAHTYPAPGSYAIVVSVADKGGSTTQVRDIYTVRPPPAVGARCKSPVPAIGAIQGLYGQPPPSFAQPNWGISRDDRVLRFGNLVLCAVDRPWTYDGASSSVQLSGLQRGALPLASDARCCNGIARLPSAPGVFETRGRVIVNGLELEPVNQSLAPMTVDTSAASISGPSYHVFLAQTAFDNYPQQEGELGVADLTSAPWVLEGDSLGYLSQGVSGDGFNLSGPVHIRVDGLGSSAIDATVLLPSVFSLQAYSGGPPTSPVTFAAEYPGALAPGTAHDSVSPALARSPVGPAAHAADGGCTYPAPTAPINLEAPDLYLGGIELHCAYIEYDPSTGDAAGGGGFGIGPVYVNGFLKLDHNAFAGAGGGIDGLDVPIFPGVTLDSIHFSVFLDPSRFHASAGLGLAGGLASLDGGALTVFATNAHPYSYNQDKPFTGQDDIPGVGSILDQHPFTTFAIGAGGSFNVLDLPLHIDGYGLYVYPDYIEFGGHMGLDVLDGAVKVDAHLSGQFWIADGSFDIEGGAQVCLPVLGCNGASGVISSNGIIGCWDQNLLLGTLSVGGGYHFGDTWPSIYFHGCTDSFGDYRVSEAADIAQATGARTFIIRPGLPNAMFRIVGSSDSPAFTITGPNGAHASTGADDTITGDRQFVLMRSHQFDTTWVGIAHPAAGRWTFTPLPGSATVTQTFFSPGVPPASVTARVLGHGRARLLRYAIRPRPDQTVQFVETGSGVSSPVGTTRATNGTIRFAPAIGPAGPRQIIAIVTLGGMPAKRITVASYIAPGPPQAARPPQLRLIRHGQSLKISWGLGTNTTSDQVIVRASDGRRLLFHPASHSRVLTLGGFSTSGATVEVRGVGPDGNTGPPATARLMPLGPPGKVTNLTVTSSGQRISISWRPAPRAIGYRVVLTLQRYKPLMLAVKRYTLSFRLHSKRFILHVAVQPEGLDGTLGGNTQTTLRAGRRRH